MINVDFYIWTYNIWGCHLIKQNNRIQNCKHKKVRSEPRPRFSTELSSIIFLKSYETCWRSSLFTIIIIGLVEAEHSPSVLSGGTGVGIWVSRDGQLRHIKDFWDLWTSSPTPPIQECQITTAGKCSDEAGTEMKKPL